MWVDLDVVQEVHALYGEGDNYIRWHCAFRDKESFVRFDYNEGYEEVVRKAHEEFLAAWKNRDVKPSA